MGREYEPTVGQWYDDLENDETFQVLKVDEDKETVEIQHLDGDTEELDVDDWAELDLELTESMMMDNVELAVVTLGKLKAMGIKLSIDDFGTGYSSLSHLKRFPIDVLKIDQSFVRDMTNDPDGAAIVRSIITLAHSLKLKVIAEGVETEGQLNYLSSHLCDAIQGYYFSRPVPATACEQLLQQGKYLRCPSIGCPRPG